MASRIELLQSAGYSEDDIAAWANERRTILSGAGFKDNEIDAYFAGSVTAPDKPPAALIDRVRVGQSLGRILEQTSKGLAEGYGTPTPTGFDDKTLDELIKLGIFHDPLKDKAGPLQIATETAVMPLAKGVDVLMRGVSAGIHGAGELLGAVHDELGLNIPGTRGTGQSLAREVVNFGNWALIEGGMGRFARPRVGAAGAAEEPIGGLAKADDFVNASKAVGDNTAPMPVQEKLLQLYEQQGRHPAEVAADAAADPVVQQKLLSKDPLDMPYKAPAEAAGEAEAVGGKPPAEPPKPPAEPPEAPPPAGSLEEARAHVHSRISVGEREPRRPLTFDPLYTELIHDLHPIKAVGEDAYQMARLTRGQFGKAEYFLERGTFDFDTFANTG